MKKSSTSKKKKTVKKATKAKASKKKSAAKAKKVAKKKPAKKKVAAKKVKAVKKVAAPKKAKTKPAAKKEMNDMDDHVMPMMDERDDAQMIPMPPSELSAGGDGDDEGMTMDDDFKGFEEHSTMDSDDDEDDF